MLRGENKIKGTLTNWSVNLKQLNSYFKMVYFRTTSKLEGGHALVDKVAPKPFMPEDLLHKCCLHL